MSRSSPHLRISVSSRYEHIDLVQITIDEALTQQGLDEEARYCTSVALREGVANAIKHGNRQDPEKAVEVDLIVEDGYVTIHIGDRGAGFDLDAVADPLDPKTLADPPTSGRGILFMKSFVDTIEYSPRSGGGTLVTLRKRLA